MRRLCDDTDARRILNPGPVAIVTATWYFVELAGKFAAPGAGQSFAAGGFGWVIMFAALASGAILGIRGAWKLRRKPSVAEVFE